MHTKGNIVFNESDGSCLNRQSMGGRVATSHMIVWGAQTAAVQLNAFNVRINCYDSQVFVCVCMSAQVHIHMYVVAFMILAYMYIYYISGTNVSLSIELASRCVPIGIFDSIYADGCAYVRVWVCAHMLCMSQC